MEWWQGFLIAIGTYAATKAVDELLAWFREKRDFRKFRREKACTEIEELKNKIGQIYEYACDEEFDSDGYHKVAEECYFLIGRSNKYPEIAEAGRATVDLCCAIETSRGSKDEESREYRSDLPGRFRRFLEACDKYTDNLL
jgi:hypothetical protein